MKKGLIFGIVVAVLVGLYAISFGFNDNPKKEKHNHKVSGALVNVFKQRNTQTSGTITYDASESDIWIVSDVSSTINSITYPLPTSPVDGQIMGLSTRSAITTLTVTSGAIPVSSVIASMPASGSVSWMYCSASNRWFTMGAESLSAAGVIATLGFTPYNSTNPSSYITQSGARTSVSLTTTGTSGAATYNNSTGVFNIPQYTSTNPGANTATGYSSGSVYSLTTSMAKVDFGTTDPALTIPAAGTYLILTNIKLAYNGLLSATNKTVTLKLRRTNNTAADLSNSTTTFVTQIVSITGLTGTAGDCDIPTILYTTSNSNDAIELQGQISASVTGSMDVQEASIVAIRIN